MVILWYYNWLVVSEYSQFFFSFFSLFRCFCCFCFPLVAVCCVFYGRVRGGSDDDCVHIITDFDNTVKWMAVVITVPVICCILVSVLLIHYWWCGPLPGYCHRFRVSCRHNVLYIYIVCSCSSFSIISKALDFWSHFFCEILFHHQKNVFSFFFWMG